MGLRVEVPSSAPMLLLKESDGQRYLPIWIGATEASAIVNALEGIVAPRPMTHDLMADILSQLGHVDVEGRITDVVDGTFYAELVVDGRTISARPSDVVALASYFGTLLVASVSLRLQRVLLEHAGLIPVETISFLDRWLGSLLLAVAFVLVLLVP